MLHQVVLRAVDNDPKMGRLVSYWLVTVLLYFLCLSIVWLEVLTGAGHFTAAAALTALSCLGHAGFYILIRQSRRLGLTPAQLSVYQGRFAILITCLGYPIVGPFRGACLVVLLVTLVFCAFTLEAKKTHSLSVFAIALLGAMMILMSRVDPHFDARVELVHFILIGTMMAVVGILTGRMSDMRGRLQQQKKDLATALIRIQELAIRDTLTDLPNRRFMADLLQSDAPGLPARPLCLAVLDIDFFKKINDTHGHAAGDEVLRRFAEEGRTLLRPADVFARGGGEEFLLLLSQTTLVQAQAILERFRRHTESWAVTHGDARLTVTVSAGLVELREGEAFEAGISRADALLYQAKSEGRNRVIVETPSSAVPLQRDTDQFAS
jgi:diguanylate cyclase (GGDEF)-like protein